MKAETLMNIPLILPINAAKPAVTSAAPARKLRIGWIIPCTAMVAAIIAYQSLSNLAELNRCLDELTLFMQSPQF